MGEVISINRKTERRIERMLMKLSSRQKLKILKWYRRYKLFQQTPGA